VKESVHPDQDVGNGLLAVCGLGHLLGGVRAARGQELVETWVLSMNLTRPSSWSQAEPSSSFWASRWSGPIIGSFHAVFIPLLDNFGVDHCSSVCWWR
jgi:hypothetical protein